MRELTLTILAAVAATLLTQPISAQQLDPLVTPPPNAVLPNANGVPVGPFGGLEAGAYAARVDDPSAAWFNPAGLSRAKTAQISGSGGLYQFTSVSPTSLPNSGGGLQQVPNLIGFSVRAAQNCTFGFALLTTNSWQQETDSELIFGTAASGERFGYSADADFSKRNLNVGGGCEHGRLRFGGGLAFSVVTLRLVDTASDRLSSATGLRTVLFSARRSGDALQLRSILGFQYDPSDAWRVGVVVRTPAGTLHRSGVFAADGTVQSGAASQGLSFFDDNASFTYKVPWEIQGGVAYVRPRAQAEVDVQGFTGVSSYALLASSNPVVTYGDAGQGTLPTIQTRPFTGLFSASRAIANVAAGGHYQVSTNHSYLVHVGFTTDRSPVASEDQVFDRVDMYGWTLGMSGKAAKLQFAAGINFRRGTSGDIHVHDLLTGQPVVTSLKTSTTALIYSLSYEF